MSHLSKTGLLLRAYYETLHDYLTQHRDVLDAWVEKLLTEELARPIYAQLRPDAFEAYHAACIAFIEERLESYNPIGVQYTFDRRDCQTAAALEMQLDWFDSTEEWIRLREATQRLAEDSMTDERLHELATALIREVGAFPNSSILNAYDTAPAPNKIPDAIVARAINTVLENAC